MRGQSNFGKPGDLVGVGVGQRQRVAAAAVEGAAQVQHPGAQRRVDAARLVVPALPVERDLERVLHRQRAAVDEEQMRQGGVAEYPREGLDEPGHRHGVDVGVGRLVDGGLRQFGAETVVIGQRRVVHAQRRGREEGEHVEVVLAVAGVDQMGSGRAVQVEHQVQPVGQDAAGQALCGHSQVRRQDAWEAGDTTSSRDKSSVIRRSYRNFYVLSASRSAIFTFDGLR